LNAIVKYIPGPSILEGVPQMLITSLDYSNYVGELPWDGYTEAPSSPTRITRCVNAMAASRESA